MPLNPDLPPPSDRLAYLPTVSATEERISLPSATTPNSGSESSRTSSRGMRGVETLGTSRSLRRAHSNRWEGGHPYDDREDQSSIAFPNSDDITSSDMDSTATSSIAAESTQDDLSRETPSADRLSQEFQTLVRGVVRQNDAFNPSAFILLHEYLSNYPNFPPISPDFDVNSNPSRAPQSPFHEGTFQDLDTNLPPNRTPDTAVWEASTAASPTAHNTTVPPATLIDEDFVGFVDHPLGWGNSSTPSQFSSDVYHSTRNYSQESHASRPPLAAINPLPSGTQSSTWSDPSSMGLVHVGGDWSEGSVAISSLFAEYDAAEHESDDDGLEYTDIESDNPDFARFCEKLFFHYAVDPDKSSRIATFAREIKKWKRPEEVTPQAMKQNNWDCQGIPWGILGMQKETFRKLRNQEYQNYRNIRDIAYATPESIPENRRFFRFRRQDNQRKIRRVHFQLRNLLGVTSKNDVFYAGNSRVWRTDPCAKKTEVTMDLTNLWSYGSMKITTMAANHNVVIAGGFHGEYAMKHLGSPYDSMHTSGAVTHNVNGITNHVHLHLARTSGNPYAVFSSNDNRVRVLDCFSNTFVGDQEYEWPVNCAATSPDGRLRVIVGDQKDVLIVDADRGMVLRTLEGHQDYGFACAWSDDGHSIATGNQDKTVRIYDARNFGKCLKEIGAEIAGVRALRFSSNGAGRRVLVLAEPADYVSVIDAKTWDGMQKFEHFGEIGGVEFTPDGEELFIANTDKDVGGLMEFERTRFDHGWCNDSDDEDILDSPRYSYSNDESESDEEAASPPLSRIPLPTAPENWSSDDSCSSDWVMGPWESTAYTNTNGTSVNPLSPLDFSSTSSTLSPWSPNPSESTRNNSISLGSTSGFAHVDEDGDHDLDLDPLGLSELSTWDSALTHTPTDTCAAYPSAAPPQEQLQKRRRLRTAVAKENIVFRPMSTSIKTGRRNRRGKRMGVGMEGLFV